MWACMPCANRDGLNLRNKVTLREALEFNRQDVFSDSVRDFEEIESNFMKNPSS